MVTRGTADRGAPPPAPSGTGSLSAEGAQRVRRERTGGLFGRSPLLGAILALVVVALIAVAAASGSTAVLAAVGALLVVVAVFAIVYGITARRATARDVARQPDAESRTAARDEPMPGAFMKARPGVELGDTAEAHDDINPHDLPPDHPGRRAAEEQAGGAGAAIRGNTGA